MGQGSHLYAMLTHNRNLNLFEKRLLCRLLLTFLCLGHTARSAHPVGSLVWKLLSETAIPPPSRALCCSTSLESLAGPT